MVCELKPEQFTERLLPIFESVFARFPYPGKFHPGYFFPHWRHMMELGVARTWEQGPGDAVLGAIFSPNTFTGEKTAFVHFWFKRAGAPDASDLLDAAARASETEGCTAFYSSAYGDSPSMEKKYQDFGFKKSETVFRAIL